MPMPRATRRSTQSGMTLLPLLGVLVVMALIFSMVVKLAPVYIQHYNVVTSLKNISAERTSDARVSKRDIRAGLLRQFDVNDIELGKEDVLIEMKKGRAKVTVDYEVRKSFIANIDLIVHFNNSVEF